MTFVGCSSKRAWCSNHAPYSANPFTTAAPFGYKHDLCRLQQQEGLGSNHARYSDPLHQITKFSERAFSIREKN